MFNAILPRKIRFSHFIFVISFVFIFSGTATAADNQLLPLDLSSVPEQTRSQLPLPYGLAVNYTYLSEDLDIRKFNLQVDGNPVPTGLVSLDRLQQRTDAETFRVDAWLMSFLVHYQSYTIAQGSPTIRLFHFAMLYRNGCQAQYA